MVGEVATRLKNRLDLIYGSRQDTNERMFRETRNSAAPVLVGNLTTASRLSTEINRKCHKFQPSFGGANWREQSPAEEDLPAFQHPE